MNLKTVVLACSMLAASSAFAGLPTRVVPLDLGNMDLSSVNIGNTFYALPSGAAYSFNDVYYFNLTVPTDASGALTSSSKTAFYVLLTDSTLYQVDPVSHANIGGPLLATLDKGIYDPAQQANIYNFIYPNLTSGSYALTITGTVAASKNGSYGGTLETAALVPEPGALALALAGIGIAGLVRHRQRAAR